jgi:ribose/xylose/arabinose/galactoside ABC-type transport system permease subunit
MMLARRTRTLALALCGWTVFTWITRVPLLLSGDESALGLLPVVVFLVAAGATAVAVLRRLDVAGTAVVAFAAWTVAYWAVRLALIATNDHPVGFVVVHAVLGLVAGTLAVLSGRAALADGAGPAWARRSLA